MPSEARNCRSKRARVLFGMRGFFFSGIRQGKMSRLAVLQTGDKNVYLGADESIATTILNIYKLVRRELQQGSTCL